MAEREREREREREIKENRDRHEKQRNHRQPKVILKEESLVEKERERKIETVKRHS